MDVMQTYGGGLWHKWCDTDLTLVGTVILKAADGSLKDMLVKVSRLLISVPTLAIHRSSPVLSHALFCSALFYLVVLEH